ncbi:MAG: nuclear transport factor 2 family protein [Haloplanus sp.]
MASEPLSAERGVRAASDRFYDALNRMANGDAGPMSAVWSHRDDVTTMHPIGGREVGWDEVRGPWQSVADVASDGSVERTDQLIRVAGELAYELVTERVSMSVAGEPMRMETRATNVYRLEDGEWKVVHHHTDANEEFIELLGRLDAAE